MNPKKVVQVVWNNGPAHRYIPRATAPGRDTSWRVWDQKLERFIRDSELRGIDPSEPRLTN